MLSDHFSQSSVEFLTMFMQYHRICVPVQLLKAEATVVLPLYLLDCIFQKIPNAVHIFLIHSHLQKEKVLYRMQKDD